MTLNIEKMIQPKTIINPDIENKFPRALEYPSQSMFFRLLIGITLFIEFSQ